MVDSEKLSLCCSDEGRYLLLEAGRGVEGWVERTGGKQRGMHTVRRERREERVTLYRNRGGQWNI